LNVIVVFLFGGFLIWRRQVRSILLSQRLDGRRSPKSLLSGRAAGASGRTRGVVMQEWKWCDAIPLVDPVKHVFPLTVNTITCEKFLDIFTRRQGRGKGEELRHATLDLAARAAVRIHMPDSPIRGPLGIPAKPSSFGQFPHGN
jgi:hypothetical protein